MACQVGRQLRARVVDDALQNRGGGARDWMDHSRKDRIQRTEMTQGGRYFIYRPPPDCISSPDHTGRSGARLTRRLAGAPEAWSVHTASASMAPS